MAVGEQLSISLIVPVHNGADDLAQCLASAAACVPAAAEIIVVDDASSDTSFAVAQRAGARALQLTVQKGPAYARNRGAELARGDLLFFVDADVALAPDATAHALDAFAGEPHLAAVFGSYDADPAARNFLSRYKNLLHHWVHQAGREDASTFWAGCGAVRRDVFTQVGGFDESYARPSIEDIELGSRLRRAGYAIRLRKSLQGKHLKRWTVSSLLTADIRDRALPWAALLLRDGLVNDLNLRWSNRLSGAAAQMMLATVVAGWWWPSLWVVSAALAAVLLVLDAPLYSFFRRRGGVVFAAGCIMWHWLYYLYSGAAFALVLLSHLANRRDRAPRKEVPLDLNRLATARGKSAGDGAETP